MNPISYLDILTIGNHGGEVLNEAALRSIYHSRNLHNNFHYCNISSILEVSALLLHHPPDLFPEFFDHIFLGSCIRNQHLLLETANNFHNFMGYKNTTPLSTASLSDTWIKSLSSSRLFGCQERSRVSLPRIFGLPLWTYSHTCAFSCTITYIIGELADEIPLPEYSEVLKRNCVCCKGETVAIAEVNRIVREELPLFSSIALRA